MNKMSKRERLEATINGQPVDRPAVCLWRHWPGDDQSGEALARASLHWQQTFDFDFAKIMLPMNYVTFGWGSESRYVGDMVGDSLWGSRVVQQPEDWAKLTVLDPVKGRLGEMHRCLDILGRALGEKVPFIATVLDPLALAKKLVGPRIFAHLRQHPEALKAGLETITRTTVRFVDAICETGVSGIFYALQFARYERLSEEEYRLFGRPYDLRILKAADRLWFNVLHIHGEDIMFDLVADYPVQAVNWHDRETPPTLHDALDRVPGAVVGGVRQWDTMVRGTPEQVRAEVHDAAEQTGGRRLVVGTGCSTPIVTPFGNVWALREAVEAAVA